MPSRQARLIPRDSLAGGALLAVIAIMTFLACLTASVALMASEASRSWRSQVLSQVTVQIKPPRDGGAQALVDKVVAAASGMPGVVKVHAYTPQESENLLSPWLGSGLDLSLLPIPRLVVVVMQDTPSADQVAQLRDAVLRAVPSATLDDHRLWASRIGTMANAVVAVALFILGLMLVTMATAIAFATRGAMAGASEIIEVLHFVGASDAFIAREFQSHFARLGLQGALIGGLSAVAFSFLMSALSTWWANTTGGREVAAMFGSFSLPAAAYLVLFLVGAAITLLTGYVSRGVVFRFLGGLR
jgi:cell division transport system permease protein